MSVEINNLLVSYFIVIGLLSVFFIKSSPGICNMIFWGYKLLTLVIPVLVLYLTKSIDYFNYSYLPNISYIYWHKTIELIIIFFLSYFLIIVFYKILFLKQLNKIRLPSITFNSPHIGLFLIVTLSIAAKLYLIKSGSWFLVRKEGAEAIVGALDAIMNKVILLETIAMFSFAFKDLFVIKKNSAILIVMSIQSVAFSAISGSKEKIIISSLPILLFMLVNINKKLRLPIIACLILVFILLMPTMQAYTHAVRYSGDVIPSYSELIKSIDDIKDDAEETSFTRWDYFNPLVKSVIANDFRDDFELGSGYLNNFIVMVPRLLWPEKPIFSYGNDVGRKINVLNSNDYITSIGITPIGEGYLLYGYFGVFLAALIMSIIAIIFDLMLKENLYKGALLGAVIQFAKADWISMILPNVIVSIILVIVVVYFTSSKMDLK